LAEEAPPPKSGVVSLPQWGLACRCIQYLEPVPNSDVFDVPVAGVEFTPFLARDLWALVGSKPEQAADVPRLG
jgi:hypothetical protein